MARLGRRQPSNVWITNNVTVVSVSVTGDATIVGTGTVDAPSFFYEAFATATITGAGEITSSSITTGFAAITGAGTITGESHLDINDGFAAITGTGTITALFALTSTATATIEGFGVWYAEGLAPEPIIPPTAIGPQIPAPQFQFLVEDIMSGIIKTQDFPLDAWSYNDTLNRAGALQGSVAITSEFATEEILDPWRTAIYVMREGRIEWGGILVPPTLGVGDSVVSVNCFGWLGYWDHRVIRDDYKPAGVEQFEIFRTLVRDSQEFSDGYELNIDVVWDAVSGVARDRAENYRVFNAKNYGEALRQLAAVDAGFDFAMTYTVNTATDRIDKNIKLFYPRKGRDTEFLFEYERDKKTNVISRGFADPVDFAWTGDGWGSGNDETRLRSSYIDPSLRNLYPPYDAAPTFSSVIEPATLSANTDAFFARRNRPRRIPILRVNPEQYPRWGEAEIGDTVGVRIRDGYGSTPGVVPQRMRITGTKVSADGGYDLVLADPLLAEQEAN